MCEYCKKQSTLIEKEVPTEVFGHFTGYKILSVVFDTRGYLRLGDKEDMGCLDHDEKIEANYCFNYGRQL